MGSNAFTVFKHLRTKYWRQAAAQAGIPVPADLAAIISDEWRNRTSEATRQRCNEMAKERNSEIQAAKAAAASPAPSSDESPRFGHQSPVPRSRYAGAQPVATSHQHHYSSIQRPHSAISSAPSPLEAPGYISPYPTPHLPAAQPSTPHRAIAVHGQWPGPNSDLTDPPIVIFTREKPKPRSVCLHFSCSIVHDCPC